MGKVLKELRGVKGKFFPLLDDQVFCPYSVHFPS